MWTAAGGKDYAGKPRPVVIIQDEHFGTESITICSFTSDLTPADIFRPLVQPAESNGLRVPSRLMVDKITTMPRTKLGHCIGQLSDEDQLRLNHAIVVFLGVSG